MDDAVLAADVVGSGQHAVERRPPDDAVASVGVGDECHSALTEGRPVEVESTIGARTGEDISTDAAIAAGHSDSATTLTAVGRWPRVVEGKTASATAAAFAAGLSPSMRLVFLVARAG